MKGVVMKIILGILAGSAIGSIIGYTFKCHGGTCPLSCNPYMMAIIGAVVGAVLVNR